MDRIAAWRAERLADAETLYPLVREWPGSTRTAEALLVRRDGDDALFLSELRHERGAALAKRIPLARTNAVSVLAATEAVGVREGVDYRGAPVLADIRPVPDSTWRLVAKVDRDEIFETERQLAWAAWAALSAFVALGDVLAATWVRAERHRRSCKRSSRPTSRACRPIASSSRRTRSRPSSSPSSRRSRTARAWD